MSLLSFLNWVKPKHIIVTSVLLVSINMLINLLLPASTETLEFINGIFGAVFSLLFAVASVVIYYISHLRGFAISRTLLWLGISISAWAIGDCLYLYLLVIHVDPFISPVDFFYVGATFALLLTVLTIAGQQPPSHRRKMVFIEVSILVLSATVLFSVLLLARGKPDLSFDAFTLLMVFIYPVIDVILIWLIIIMYFAYPVKSSQRVLGYFFIGAVCLFSSDLYYLFSSLYEPLTRDYISDTGYYAFYLMVFLGGFSGYKQIRHQESENKKIVTAFKSGNWIIFIPGVFLIIVIGLMMAFVIDKSFILTHGLLILIASVIILFILHQYMVIADNIKLTKEMRQINAQLEWKVEQRTAELSKANTELNEEMKEREKAENHLARSNQDLALLNRDKDKLFSILAHDLRSPLGSMMNLTDILLENIKDFDEKELLDIIGTLKKSTTQTFQLFNDLLAWSAVQMGRGEREKELFAVAEVVSENLVILAADIERKQIEIHCNIDSNILAYADKFAIQTVIRNLISNAVKFTPKSGNVSIEAERHAEMIKISVLDSGVGIPRDKQRRIFRVDSVSSSAGTDGEKGSGFGLLLCKDLVERNDGKIWLESEKGIGSAFHFTLPSHPGNSSPVNKIPATRVQYTCDDALKIGFTTMVGEINPSVLRSELSLIWSSDSYNADYSVLADLRQATFVIETNDIPVVLAMFSEMPGNKKNKKFALLTATPQQVAFSTMFGQNIKSKYPFIVEIFSTYEAAINWLGA